MMIVRSQPCSQRSVNRLAAREQPSSCGVFAPRSFTGNASLVLPFRAHQRATTKRRVTAVQAAQTASNKPNKIIKKVVGALPIVILIGLALVPVCMTLASALKFGAASKTYQGVGNYYDAGIPIAVKAAAACLGAIFGFIHDMGELLFGLITNTWVFWPMVVIGLAAVMFRD